MNNRLDSFTENELLVIQRGLVDVCEECLTLAMHPVLRKSYDTDLEAVAMRFGAAGPLMVEIDGHLGADTDPPTIEQFADIADLMRAGGLDGLEAAIEVLP